MCKTLSQAYSHWKCIDLHFCFRGEIGRGVLQTSHVGGTSTLLSPSFSSPSLPLPFPLPLPSLPSPLSFLPPLLPSLLSSPLPSPSFLSPLLRSRPLIAVNFRLKISPLVATIFRSFSGNETSSSSNWGLGGRVGQFHTKRTLQNSHSIWMHGVTRTRPIFPVFAFKVMHRVILVTRFYKLLTTVAILSGGARASSASMARRPWKLGLQHFATLCIYPLPSHVVWALNRHSWSTGLVIAVFGPSKWKCITDVKNWSKIGEGLIGYWPATKTFLLFGPLTSVQNFINIE